MEVRLEYRICIFFWKFLKPYHSDGEFVIGCIMKLEVLAIYFPIYELANTSTFVSSGIHKEAIPDNDEM